MKIKRPVMVLFITNWYREIGDGQEEQLPVKIFNPKRMFNGNDKNLSDSGKPYFEYRNVVAQILVMKQIILSDATGKIINRYM